MDKNLVFYERITLDSDFIGSKFVRADAPSLLRHAFHKARPTDRPSVTKLWDDYIIIDCVAPLYR